MQSTKFNDSSATRPATKTQKVVYAWLILGTVSAVAGYGVNEWHRFHPAAPAPAPAATGTPVATTTPKARETLAAEVQRQTGKWQTENFAWNLTARTPVLQDVLPVDMASVEGSDVSRNRAGLIQAGATLPSLAGAYKRGRVCASDWPRAGSAAVEFLPTEATDPENPAKPWRVILFYQVSNEATGFLRQAVADGRAADETLALGSDSQAIAAVPVDRTEVDGVTTFYCVSPLTSTVTISGVKLMQRVEPATTAEQEAHNRWQVAHDGFLSRARQKANAATTPEAKAAVGQEIDQWQAANPEPPRPTAKDDGQANNRTAVSRSTATATDPNAIPPIR